eukprot:CAMPEP_0205800036 /NCGR_PEP_ID=MMETSP0205-20121125/1540_1 /ASSEMBLY_ACC=CAM_ASM_000278 /TAXON_ID=36767 /ORGANISM="Euplotes focardii, Strain TN1" /LENGTH=95 /DNA_ID=CAMNT_0053062413 /DNA_START=67 /DNA_END=351 /DNA_ORIENTATION=+
MISVLNSLKEVDMEEDSVSESEKDAIRIFTDHIIDIEDESEQTLRPMDVKKLNLMPPQSIQDKLDLLISPYNKEGLISNMSMFEQEKDIIGNKYW